MVTALVGGAIGMAAGGPEIAIAAAIGAGAIGAIGTHGLRQRSQGPSVIIDAAQRREMKAATRMAIATTWALRPLMDVHADVERKVVQDVFDRVVWGYAVDVTPHVQPINQLLFDVARSGIRPDDDLAYVRRNHAPRFMRKCDDAVYLAIHVLEIQEQYAPLRESADRFVLWCGMIGIGHMAQGLWEGKFGTEPMASVQEYREWRHKEALRSYWESEDAEDAAAEAAAIANRSAAV